MQDQAGEISTADVIITIVGKNESPTEIKLSNREISELDSTGDLVGEVTVVDPDEGDTHTLELIDDAEGRFSLSGTELLVADSTDFAAGQSYVVRLRATDVDGASWTQGFLIQIVEQPAEPHLVVDLLANSAVSVTVRRNGDDLEIVDNDTNSLLVPAQPVLLTESVTIIGQNLRDELVLVDF